MKDRKGLFMEKNQMNYPGRRPYTHTCGMSSSPRAVRSVGCMPCPNTFPDRECSSPQKDCHCLMPGTVSNDEDMYSHLQHLVPAMAYVPCQFFTTAFDLDYALSAGTIFPQLCKPFCGKRGGCR